MPVSEDGSKPERGKTLYPLSRRLSIISNDALPRGARDPIVALQTTDAVPRSGQDSLWCTESARHWVRACTVHRCAQLPLAMRPAQAYPHHAFWQGRRNHPGETLRPPPQDALGSVQSVDYSLGLWL